MDFCMDYIQNGHKPKWPWPKLPQTRRKRPYWKSKTATDQNGYDQNGHMRNSEVSVRNSFSLFAWHTCGENWSATCAIATTNACDYQLNIKHGDVISHVIGQMSLHYDLPLCHWTSVKPSGRFPSILDSPAGSFVMALQLWQRIGLLSRWGHGALLTGPELSSCKQNYGAHGHPQQNNNTNTNNYINVRSKADK